MTALGANVSSRDPETQGNNLRPGHVISKELYEARQKSEAAWMAVSDWEPNSGVSITRLLELANEAQEEAMRIYREENK